MLAKQLQGAAKSAVPQYIEDVFSTYLYTGTGSSQTITNNIDTTTYGGLVWIKGRSGATGHRLTDTARGTTKSLESNSTAAEATESTGLTAFGTTGFTIGADADYNTNTATYASWTFRKQAKFFDVVTFTQSGASTGYTTINHSLASAPGMVIIKSINNAGSYWNVWHRSEPTKYLYLNTTNASATGPLLQNVTSTSFDFNLGAFGEGNGIQYVAYLFAHDAGGFGAAGTDNVISCGSFTTDAGGAASVTLNYEPQWVLLKKSSAGVEDWYLFDSMRGIATGGVDAQLNPNLSAAEASTFNYINLTATGFGVVNQSSSATYIYIAIRRGPMKTPTSGTSVFSPVTDTGTAAAKSISAGLTVDAGIRINRDHLTWSPNTVYDRLRGATVYMNMNTTAADIDFTPFFTSFDQSGITLTNSGFNGSGATYINYFFRRAPGFFDVVCYTGNGADPQTVSHNLSVAPELMIFKARNAAAGWRVWGGNMAITEYLALNETSAVVTGSTFFGSTLPTAASFYVGGGLNVSTRTHVAYLFATVTGVSKVGSYTGTGTTKQIDCGFAAGARFVMIKRTDSTGDWYVWDTARGIVSGNDPYLLINSTAAEVTSTDYIDPLNAGFEISSTAPAAINANGGTFIFLAIS